MTNQILAQLGVRPLRDAEPTKTQVQLKEFEDLIGTRLPSTYADMLLEYGVPVCFEKEVWYRPEQKSPWATKDGYQMLELFYGLSGNKQSLVHQRGVYFNRMPPQAVPIGEGPGGNIICLLTKGAKTGKVYLWDHEAERSMTGVTKNDFGNMYLIAHSFDQFLGLLGTKETESHAEDDGITDVWLADDL